MAVGLLNSYANPINEEKIKTLIKQLNPNIFVSLSSTIPKFRALKRFTTAVMRACLQPVVKNYLESLYNRLKEKRFQGRFMVVTNNGGMIDAKVAIERPELMLTSGPASGVNAAMFISEGLGIKDSITMDMGGTSCDVSIIEKAQPLVTSEYELDFDIPVSVPMLDIRAIGAGGGSIAWIDEGGSLKVGPRSAGSFPGPACYARGGFQPTVTDANLLLGRINKRQMFGKEVQLDIKASEKAIKTLSHQVDLDLIQTADGILTIVNENITSALKQVSLDRGRDPRDFCLVAFGGAGPMHAAFLAKTMNINKVIIPRDAGILSAFGGIVMDFKHGFQKTLYCPINNVDYVSLNKRYHELGQKALESIVQQGIHKKNIKVNRSAQMRFVGQTYEVETPIPDGKIGPKEIETIRINFYNEHEKEYGLADRELPVAFVNLRSTAIGKVQKPSFEVSHIENEATENIQVVVRSVYFKDYGFTETEVFDRRFLATGFRVKGPAILEDDMSTTVIAPEMIAEIDGYGNIIIFIN